MKKKILILGVFFCILASSNFAMASIPSGIITAINNGDASSLARHFNTTVELTVGSNEQLCSKVQAEMILKDFFKTNRPTGSKVLHQSGSSAKYCILQLTTQTNDYRITILLKPVNNIYLIHQIRID